MGLLGWFWRLVDIVMAVLLCAMIVLVFTNVVLRYGFSSGLRESIELSRLAFVWLVLLGAAVLLRKDEHLAVRDVVEQFVPRAIPVLRRLAYGVIALASVMLFWGAFNQMNANWNNISQLTGLPSALPYLAGVVGGGLMAIIAIVRIVDPDAMQIEDDKPREDAES